MDYQKGLEVGSAQYVRNRRPFLRVSDIHDLDLQQKK